MRYRLRDMLLLTSLLAIYFTACRFALQDRTAEEFFGILIGALVGSGVFMVVFFGFALWSNRKASSRARNILAELPLDYPWASLFWIAAVTFVTGLLAQLHPTLFGAFCGTSVVFWMHLVLSLLHSSVKLSTEGILFRSAFLEWGKVYPLRAADGTLKMLRLHNPWFGPKVAIPADLCNQVETLLPSKN